MEDPVVSEHHRVARPVRPGGAATRQLARRFDVLRDDPRVGGALLALVAVAVGAFWYRSATTTPAPIGPIAGTTVAASSTIPSATSTTSNAPSEFIVHVAGAVRAPGVVRVGSDSRVVDAIDAAGGPLPTADLDRLNLAAPVHDGERVFVAKVGDPPSAGVVANGTPTGAGDDGDTAPLIVNLNTATAAELETLPGIGPTLAAAILAERDRRGGFTSIDDLRSVRGIGEGRFAALSDLVTV